MRQLIRLYPRRWRDRYAEEMEALLDERPLGPYESVDLILGAIDAHLHLRGLGNHSEHRKGITMSLRLAGYSALVSGALWALVALLLVLDSGSSESSPLAFVVGFFAATTLLLAVAGLSRRQAQQSRGSAWIGFVVPAIGTALLILTMAIGAVSSAEIEPVVWPLFLAAWFMMPLGSVVFGTVAVHGGGLSRVTAVLLVGGSLTMVVMFLLTMMAPWNDTWSQLLNLAGLLAFAGGWAAVGVDAIRRDQALATSHAAAA